jgi:hypothetical protein
MRYLLVGFLFCCIAAQAQVPLSDAAFSKSFRCPEDLPTDQARQDAIYNFLAWVQQRYPGLTIAKIAEIPHQVSRGASLRKDPGKHTVIGRHFRQKVAAQSLYGGRWKEILLKRACAKLHSCALGAWLEELPKRARICDGHIAVEGGKGA